MEIKDKCKKCGQDISAGYKCEECEKVFLSSPITVFFDRDHYLWGEERHFCGNKCVIAFFKKESKK